jgi:hypothetical protein
VRKDFAQALDDAERHGTINDKWYYYAKKGLTPTKNPVLAQYLPA